MKIKSPVILIIISTIIWGATAPIMKLTLLEVPPFMLAFIRMFFATFLILPFAVKTLKVQKEDIFKVILCTLTGTTFNISLFFLGVKLAPAINAALLIAAIPVLTLALSSIYLKEKIGTKIIIASVLATLGVIIIIGAPQSQFIFSEFIGNILLLLSCVSWVFYEIISKKLFKKYTPMTLTFYTTSIGALTFLPIALFEHFFYFQGWQNNLSIGGILGILYGIFFASFIAYTAWQIGLAKLPAGQASFYFYLDPISGAVLAMLLLGEKLTTNLIAGSILITIGIILVEYRRKNHPLYK